MIDNYAYYLPQEQKVYGSTDPDMIARLYGLYLRYLPVDFEPGMYDGVSYFMRDGKEHIVITLNSKSDVIIYNV